MKTAVQEILEKYDEQIGVTEFWSWIHQNRKRLMGKEKEKIVNAFNYALKMRFGSESQINTGEDYYKETFKNGL